jgi:hypothetical protein
MNPPDQQESSGAVDSPRRGAAGAQKAEGETKTKKKRKKKKKVGPSRGRGTLTTSGASVTSL